MKCRNFPDSRWLVLFVALMVGVRWAGGTDVVIRDYTGRGFATDLLNYELAPPLTDPRSLRLIDSLTGQPIAAQIEQVDGRQTLSFVTALPVDGQTRVSLQVDEKLPPPLTSVAATADPHGTVLANASLAVRTPGAMDKEFDPAVPADTLPAPILAFRGADGAWRGAAAVLSKRPVQRLTITTTASGPVYAQTQYEMRFAGGGYYRATVRVIDQVPLAKVTEEFDVNELSGEDYWQLDLTTGWSPDTMEVATTNGNGSVDRGSFAPLASLGATPVPIQPRWIIVPGNAFGPRSVFGLFSAARKQADPRNYPLAGIVPLHTGQWRRAAGLEIRTADSRQIAIAFPMSARFLAWQRDVSSETSPMSVHEHDPALPTTCGQRVWGLLLGEPPVQFGVEATDSIPGPCYTARLAYGTVGLDRYKDYVLDWPDAQPEYPRIYASQGGADAGGAQRARDLLRNMARFMLTTPAFSHHPAWSDHVLAADDALAGKDLSADQRRDIRARAALIAYLYLEPDIQGHGTGNHLGNPNMSIARQSEMANFVALLPDHPMFESWRDYVASYFQYKFGINEAPGGGWFEYGWAYHIHALGRLTRGMFGIQSAEPANLDLLDNYLAAQWRYYLNLLTPFDSRWQARMIPGGANSPPGYTDGFSDAAALFAQRDPNLAANLLWGWQENGASSRARIARALPPSLSPVEPKLNSEIYPGVGVIFRAHQGPDETWMFFRSGYNWSHWHVDDQNNFALMSKGAMLVPYQPFQYFDRDSRGQELASAFNIYNTVRFGDPGNEYQFGWPDTNVIDHSFGAGVDFAWSLSGFPEWYITPGRAPGFGEPRQLAAGAAPQNGPFWWNRQVMFLKGTTASSPNYFVFRDAMTGAATLPSWINFDLLGRRANLKVEPSRIALDGEFPTRLDLLFVGTAPAAAETAEMLQPLPTNQYFWPDVIEKLKGKTVSPNWVRQDGKPVSLPDSPPDNEQRVLVRLAAAPGQDYLYIVYPRGPGENAPRATSLAAGAVKIETSDGIDYVFLSPTHMSYQGEGVMFAGRCGAVRVGGDRVTFALSSGAGRIGYQGHLFESASPFEQTVAKAQLQNGSHTVESADSTLEYKPQLDAHSKVADGVVRTQRDDVVEYLIDADTPVQFRDAGVRIDARRGAIHLSARGARFVVPTRDFARLSAGALGIHGVGPFDITIARDHVTGVVDGSTRTLVVTQPAGISRAMYHLDGVRWYAGMPDDDTRIAGLTEPQFNLALGVTSGRHELEVSEWTYPPLPPAPIRAAIKLQ